MCFHTGLASALFVTGFQPFISLLATGTVNPRATGSMLLVVWTAYLVDRLLPQPEDGLGDGTHSAVTVRRSPVLFWSLLVALLGIQLALIWETPRLAIPVAIALTLSMFYSVRIPLLAQRAKDIPYFKGFYLSFASLGTVVAFTPSMLDFLNYRTLVVSAISYVLYFLNFSLFDLKDIEADRLANIKTFAATLGADAMLFGHVTIALAAACGAMVLVDGHLSWPLSALAVFHGVVCLRLRRRPLTPALCAAIDLGYGVILGGGAALIHLS
jgi:4-hydroxybenzoate polyprenyltransferase